MTARSTRRAAEQAVIDAAYRLVDAPFFASLDKTERILRLAVENHRALGLDDTSQPAIGNNTTDTSTAAGASMNTHVGRLARQCFDEIGAVYRARGVGLTVDQLEQIMAGKHQTISARVNELRNKGWVIDSGERRPTRSGRKAIVWTPTVQAMNFLP